MWFTTNYARCWRAPIPYDPRVTGISGDRRINTALRPRVACSRETNGRLHEFDAS